MDDCFNESADWLDFLFFLARNEPASIPKQLKVDLAANVAELEAEFLHTLTQSELEYELLHGGVFNNISQVSFIDNLYYIGDRQVDYKLEDTLLSGEGIKDYWSNIEFNKLFKDYIDSKEGEIK